MWVWLSNTAILTEEQHIKTIQKASIAPAIPTIHVRRTNSKTPKIFCIHGKYTPRIVPRFAFCTGK